MDVYYCSQMTLPADTSSVQLPPGNNMLQYLSQSKSLFMGSVKTVFGAKSCNWSSQPLEIRGWTEGANFT